VFTGDFQADVSTVNNDVRHYDNATFEARFQQFQAGLSLNGWWNPIGSGAFRLINCTVQSVSYQDGSGTTDRSTDPAVGLFLAGSNDHVGAKLVDLDPQWQMSSQSWGLTMRFTDGQRPQICTGDFAPSAFRDLLFGRLVTSAGSLSASAIFQSVLTNVHWGDDLLGSRFLRELKAATGNGLMSVRLITFAYNTDRTSSRFTIGTAIGVIGPYTADEPRSFVLGRRMVPLNGQYTSDDINFFDCRVDEKMLTVFADFGNALPLTDGTGTLKDIGDLQLAVLHDETMRENQRVRRGGDFTPLGGLMPYRTSGWLRQTSGVWVAPSRRTCCPWCVPSPWRF
jgi:hypothetical protein